MCACLRTKDVKGRNFNILYGTDEVTNRLTERSSSAAITLNVLAILDGECTVLANTFWDTRNALQWICTTFESFFYAFALLETSTFQGQPNCSHQYILTHWAPGPQVKCFELCLCTRFWCFHTRSSQRERALRLQLFQGKMGTHDLPLKVSNEACARWTGTSQV